MGLSNALFASVTGLDTSSTAISVIGDNIANVSTPGFKERRAEFADLVGQSITTAGGISQIGSGSSVINISQVFSQGTFENTERATDLGIEGRGFFVLRGDQGQVYSRAGMFDFDREGYLVDPNGLRVQGFSVDPATQTSTAELTDVQLDLTLAQPNPSTGVDVSVNLDAAAVANGPFDAADPVGTASFQTVLTVFDSLGAGHLLTMHYTRDADNAWSWNATVDAAESTTPPNPGENVVVVGSGTLDFDPANGFLTGVTGGPLSVDFAGGAAPGQSVDLDFGALGPVDGVTTQFAGSGDESVTIAAVQDGFGSGTLQSLAIDRDGFLTAGFSNGATRSLARVALAIFPSVESLTSVGNNAFVETRDSGQPLVGSPGSGQFGAVRSNSIEQSNVDLADQFIRLIMNQRAFQANTRTVSTTNELLANLVQLGQ